MTSADEFLNKNDALMELQRKLNGMYEAEETMVRFIHQLQNENEKLRAIAEAAEDLVIHTKLQGNWTGPSGAVHILDAYLPIRNAIKAWKDSTK